MSNKRNYHGKAEKILKQSAPQSASSLQEAMPYQPNRSVKSAGIEKNVAVDDSSMQLRAYQIYREKGGSALDNWLEAERILKNNDQAARTTLSEQSSSGWVKLQLILVALFLTTSLLGCNMLRGAGQDVENAGGSIQRTVDRND